MSEREWGLPTLAHALERLKKRPVEVGSIISLGAGRGDDARPFQALWPQAHILLVDMDPRFVPGYQNWQAADPRIRYEICGAAAEDRVGHLRKTDQFGGAIVSEGASTEGAQETPFKRLDTLAAEHALPAPYFLMFDTHGAEVDILAGATGVLSKTSLIMMEVYNFKLSFMQMRNLTFDEMSLHMRGLGFRTVDLFHPLYRPGDAALWQLHMLFIRADHSTFSRSGYSAFRDVGQ